MDAAHYLAELLRMVRMAEHIDYSQKPVTDSHGNEWTANGDGAFEHESNEKLVRIRRRGHFMTVLVADKEDDQNYEEEAP